VIIDVHGHITHPELFKRYPMPPALADIEGMLDRKSQAGIGVTIVGSPVGFGTMSKRGHDNYAQSADELKSFHEWLAETVRKHAPRLAAYAYTNPFGDAALLDQTAQTVKDGGFVGLIVNTSVGGEYLDSPRADQFFAMAAELGKPIFLHPPAEPVGSDSIEDFRLVEQVGRFMDVTVGLATLVFAGRLEQYPDLEIVAATAGGAISLLAGRMDQAYQPRHWAGGGSPGGGPPGGGPPGGGPPSGGSPGGGVPGGGVSGSGPSGGEPGAGGPPGPPPMAQYTNKITQPPSTYLRRVYVDTANSSVPNHLANLGLMGADHMLFGTDSPPLATPLRDAIATVDGLPISAADKQGILEHNARRLFGL
jgi:aminocarboxymuconate-semialdehyde decarboxylase